MDNVVEFDLARGIIRATAVGSMVGQELVDLIGTIALMAASHPGAGVLADYRRSTVEEIQTPDVHSVVKVFGDSSETWHGRRYAMVVQGDLMFGLARMWMSLVDDVTEMETGVFKDVEPAEAWLGVTG